MADDTPHYILACFHQAGPDPRIVKGMDGSRDFFTKEELQKACWSLMQSGAPTVGLFHQDGTEGRGQIVESFLWPDDAPDWSMTATDGTTVVIKAGDWCGKILPDEVAWDLYKAGRVGGVSIQGQAKRRKRSTP
jgi:hypothetical protein